MYNLGKETKHAFKTLGRLWKSGIRDFHFWWWKTRQFIPTFLLKSLKKALDKIWEKKIFLNAAKSQKESQNESQTKIQEG